MWLISNCFKFSTYSVKRSFASEILCNEIRSSLADTKVAIMKELCDVEEKRRNLVIFGLPESSICSSVSSGWESRDHDRVLVDDLIEMLVGEKKMFELRCRIGVKRSTPRPLLVIMSDEAEKEEILRRAKSLKVYMTVFF